MNVYSVDSISVGWGVRGKGFSWILKVDLGEGGREVFLWKWGVFWGILR